ncbi:hypothetical protein H632_c3012p0, partial [Helicosporidium sp. ATCC 50920]
AYAESFESVLLYDPHGKVLTAARCLAERQAMAAFPAAVRLHRGWGPRAVAEASKDMRAAARAHQTSQDEASSAPTAMHVFLLSPEDATAPLLRPCAASETAASFAGDEGSSQALERALEAPGALKRRVQAAGGEAAGLEPDFVVVFGNALSLGGFPAWAVRSSQIYPGGALSQASGSKMHSIRRKFQRTRQRFGT